MNISRKNFIKSSSVIIGGVLFGFNNSLAKLVFRNVPGFKELRDNIGIYTEKGGTIGWFISDDASAVIDTQFPDSAEHFMTGFQEKRSGNIDFLFNTHHHRDHTSGNIFLKKYADKIVAHENCPILQKKQNHGENEKQQVYADMTFKNQWQRDLGKESINVQYLGPAHTGGDVIIYFEKANIAHLGDLVFNGIYPVIDQAGGGSIKEWITVLEAAAEKYPDDTLYIFGHAANEDMVTGNKDNLIKMRDYMTALLDFANKQIADGKDIESLKKAEFIPGFEDRKEQREGIFAANLEAAYNEIKGIKKEYE